MKVLFVNNNLGSFGGAEQYVHTVSEELAVLGHQPLFLYSHMKGVLPRALPGRAYQIPRVDRFGLDAASQARLEALLRDEEPEVVYLHNVANYRLIEWLLERRPVVRYVHDQRICCPRTIKVHRLTGQECHNNLGLPCLLFGCLFKRPQTDFPGRLYSLAAKRKEMEANRRLDRLFVASRYMRSLLEANSFPSERLTLLPHFPPVGPLDKSVASEDAGGSVLFVGQLTWHKGAHLLLRAMAYLPKKATLTIVGEGEDGDRLKVDAQRWGLAGRVRFAGWVPKEEIGRYYEQATVVAVPSIWPEAFGLVGVEAMAFAKPVVAFRVGGVSDWLEHGKTGFLVQRGYVAGLAERLGMLLEDRSLGREMGLRGRQVVKDRFSKESHLDTLLNALEEAAQCRR